MCKDLTPGQKGEVIFTLKCRAKIFTTHPPTHKTMTHLEQRRRGEVTGEIEKRRLLYDLCQR